MQPRWNRTGGRRARPKQSPAIPDPTTPRRLPGDHTKPARTLVRIFAFTGFNWRCDWKKRGRARVARSAKRPERLSGRTAKPQRARCSSAASNAASRATAASTSLADSAPCLATWPFRPSVLHQRGISRQFAGTGPMWSPRITAFAANTAKSSTRLVSRMVFIRTSVPEVRIPSGVTRVSRCQRPE
jgi:hypothetical protein